MNKRRDALRDFLTPITTNHEFSAENTPRRPQVSSGALQSMNDAITGLSNEADELRKALTDGQAIVELDANLIDASFVKDRLDEHAGAEFDALLNSIQENGQAVPVLVRPNPDQSGRYQLAYGHRRVAALKQLGLKVKSFIRDLSDDELIIAQGNENLERKNLTFIEKALFARRLEDRGTTRAVIMATFGTSSRGVLSEMIALARKLPEELIQAIGAAPGIGRPKWDSMATLLANKPNAFETVLRNETLQTLNSTERFEAIFASLKQANKVSTNTVDHAWRSDDSQLRAVTKSKPKGYAVEFSEPEGKAFGAWISDNMKRLYEEYKDSKQPN
ncbi:MULTISPECIES: plasmid partitioning protein RepB [Brucella]|uniref:Plasmid partitioning protein RepB n=1 Tax=Brucella haematophila TaxID=419474 RepID=A0ABX1DS57_9HYPH|nr:MULTISPECIES: plasmid partitioning protein RepB [Brucella]KAB2739926.1 plasmid partitioning protein RepB [Brucella anthropi]NKC05303.1 plasmid partitioning protein RepB [Brucella haematophila]TMU91168.1 plasmid partitioning protein RepB [Brucella haematophila]